MKRNREKEQGAKLREWLAVCTAEMNAAYDRLEAASRAKDAPAHDAAREDFHRALKDSAEIRRRMGKLFRARMRRIML